MYAYVFSAPLSNVATADDGDGAGAAGGGSPPFDRTRHVVRTRVCWVDSQQRFVTRERKRARAPLAACDDDDDDVTTNQISALYTRPFCYRVFSRRTKLDRNGPAGVRERESHSAENGGHASGA